MMKWQSIYKTDYQCNKQMNALQQAIQGFTFYSLSECTHQQLLSHSKHPVNIYHRKQSNEIFVLKEIPYQSNILQIYRILKDSQTLNIVPVYGLTRYILRKENDQKRITKKILVQTEHWEPQMHFAQLSNCYLRIWMPKYQKSLADYVDERRKKLSPFSAHQVKNFMFQMLTTLRILQKKGICHRDIKPQNILFNQGRYFLCDFDEAIITKIANTKKEPYQIMNDLQYTTILYSTPKFLKAIKQSKLSTKYFDPYKMDVYSFGLTLLYLCSLGKFAIDDRRLYMYTENDAHNQFIEEERRKFVKKDPELKVFNNILKLMLEEDQYKRDDFQTLNQKIIELLGIDNQSQQSFSTMSVRERRKKREKIRKSHGKGFTCGKFKPPQKFLLSAFLITLLIYFLILIF